MAEFPGGFAPHPLPDQLRILDVGALNFNAKGWLARVGAARKAEKVQVEFFHDQISRKIGLASIF